MITRAVLRDAAAPAWWTFVAASALSAVVAGVRALWTEGVVLDPLTWVRVLALAVPSLWSIALPAAAAVGIAAAVSRWVEEGAWIGARAAGLSGRHLLPAALVLGGVLAAATAAMTRAGETAARRQTARALSEAAEAASLWPGQAVDLGGVTVRPTRVADDGWSEELFLAGGGAVGTAARGRVVWAGDVLAVELEDGVMVVGDDPPVRVRFERWVRELPPPSAPRLELDQRSNAELVTVARRTERSGRDASYEWSILYKRLLHPLSALLLPVALIPAATRRRAAASVGLAVVYYLVAVRLGDHLSPSVGPLVAAAFGPVGVALWAAVAWARWGDR